MATDVAQQQMRGTSVIPNMKSLTVAFLVMAGSVALGALPSATADYPTKPIRIIVGFAAGGAPDALARIIGEKLAQDRGSGQYRDGRGRQSGRGRLHAGAHAGRQRGGQSFADPQSAL